MPHHDNVIFKSKIKNVKTFKWFFKKKQEHFGCKCSCMYHSANWLCWPVLCPPFADESISSILMFRNWPLFVLNHCGRILHFLGLNKPIVSCSFLIARLFFSTGGGSLLDVHTRSLQIVHYQSYLLQAYGI